MPLITAKADHIYNICLCVWNLDVYVILDHAWMFLCLFPALFVTTAPSVISCSVLISVLLSFLLAMGDCYRWECSCVMQNDCAARPLAWTNQASLSTGLLLTPNASSQQAADRSLWIKDRSDTLDCEFHCFSTFTYTLKVRFQSDVCNFPFKMSCKFFSRTEIESSHSK